MKHLLAFILIFAFGCSKLKEGEVIEKWYEPTNTYYYLMPMTISNGKTTTTIFIPMIITDNEDWVVRIKGNYKGKEITERLYVSEERYKCTEIGQHILVDEDCSYSDNNNIKKRK